MILTSDDGPYERPETDERLPDVLKMNGSYFNLIGYKIGKSPGIVRRMHEEGHVIANHSWDHRPVF